MNKLSTTHKLSNIFAQYSIFMKANMRSKLNNSLNLSLLRYFNLGGLLSILTTFNSSSLNGLRETKKTSFLTLSINTLITLISLYFNKFIDTLKWDQESLLNKLISVIKNMLNSHLLMLIGFFNKKCMIR